MEPSYIYFNSRDELLRVETSSIVYFEADGNYTEIVLANGLKDIVCMNLAKMQRVISVNMKDKAARFVRIGKRFIINMNYVHHIHILQQSIVLSDQKTFSYNLKKGVDKFCTAWYYSVAVGQQSFRNNMGEWWNW